MKRSTNVIVSNLSRDNILFSTFYTGLFLLFRKKTGGARAPPAPPLATALLVASVKVQLYPKSCDFFYFSEYSSSLPYY